MAKSIKQRVIRRLKITEGQTRGLQRMVGNNEYCINIITQTSAVKQAISGIENLILQNHISTHVVEQIKSGKESTVIKEILAVYNLSRKK